MRWLRLRTAVLLGIVLVAAPIALRAEPDTGSPHQDMVTAAGQEHTAGHLGAQDMRPGRVRVTLEQLLGHHSILAVRMMRAMVRDAPNLQQTLQDSLSTNTEALVAVVDAAHGRQPAATFQTLWTQHNVALIRYTRAIVANKQSAKAASQQQLDRYRRRFGAFVASATNGGLKARAVAGALKTHISQLTRQVKAYAAGNYAAAYRLERAAFAHMFPTGEALAGGLAAGVPGEFVVHLDDPGQDLRSRLGQLLGEHVELVVDATRAGITGPPGEFDQAAVALNGNTRDLSRAMEALFGRKNAREFIEVWSDHIDLVVDYTAAVAAANESDAEETRGQLEDFADRLGAFLVEATKGQREIAAVAPQLGMHDDLLLRQIDAYAAEDYAVAHRTSNRAYRHMFTIASTLGALIEERTKKAAPKGGAQTGGGGTS